VSELPELRRADCGHFIPADAPPAGRHRNGVHDQDVYLCDDCRSRLCARKVETKPGPAVEAKAVVPPAVPDAPASDLSPYAKGAKVARDGGTEENCPYSDRRTRDAKEWLRGFREANDG